MSHKFADFSFDSENKEECIEFHFEDVSFDLGNEILLQEWIQSTIRKEHAQLEHLTFIFCNDPYLHELNISYLEHDTLTDVITFPYTEPPKIEGDIFISIDRVQDNAQSFHVSFEEELYRVMIHGVLHLCGYGDKTGEETQLMRQKEDMALQLLQKLFIS